MATFVNYKCTRFIKLTPGELSRENRISSHLIITVERSPLLWLHKKSEENIIKGNVFLYFIVDYLKNRTLHSCLEI